MSLYSARVAQDSPVFYFENNSSGVNNTGSITPSIVTGSSTAFTSLGGVQNGPHMVNAGYTGEYGFEYSDSTTIFNDRVFTITGLAYLTSGDLSTGGISGNRYIFHTGTSASGIRTNSSTIIASFDGGTTSVSGTVELDRWVHYAVTVDTTNMKLYIDGSLVSTATTPATISMDSQVKYWMRETTSGTPRRGHKGKFDEWAVFNTTLSATTISEHVAAAFGVLYTATPVTASALAVEPALSLNNNLAATPLTASATLADVQVSSINLVQTLGSYLETLDLDHLYKFTDLYGGYDNYNYGAQTFYDDWNLNDWNNYEFKVGAPTFQPSIKFFDENQLWFRDGDDKQLNIDASTYDWTMGFWFKSDLASDFDLLIAYNIVEETYTPVIKVTHSTSSSEFEFSVGSTAITFDSPSTDEWHFIALKYDGEDMTAYIDGQDVATGTASVPSLGVTKISIGAPSYGYTEISNFMLTASGNISDTEIEGIYNSGNQQIQALALMPKNVLVKFNTQYNDMIESLDAIMDMRFNDESIYPPNYGTNTGAQYFPFGENILTNVDAKNVRAFKIENTDSPYGLAFQGEADMSDDQTFTVSFITKMESATADTDDVYLSLWPVVDTTIDDYGQIQLINNTTGVALRLLDGGVTPLQTYNSSYTPDDKYHHYVVTFDNSAVKLYIDGKEEVSEDFGTDYRIQDYMDIRLGALEYGEEPRTVARYIDEFAIMRNVLTAEQIFDLYQSITIDGAFSASAEFVDPTYEAGFGPTIAEPAMTASALLPNVFPFIPPMIAESLFLNPNYEAIDNTSNAAEPMTASVLFEEITFDIGEYNGAQHMDASASMGDAKARIPGRWNANPAIAMAEMVEPAISSTLGALIKPQSLNAKGMFSTPPAYILLSDDKWFERLLEQNGDRAIEPVQANLTNLPNEQSQDVIKGGFLAFFNSLALNITTTSIPNSIENQIPNYYFTKQDEYQYDSEGNILDVDTSKNIARSGAGRSSTSPTPLLSIGTYDNRERKAVNINNIEFALPGTSRNYSNRYYNLEFSFKANKKDQIISHGFYTSQTSNTRRIGVIGLSDGKIYLATDNFDPASFTFAAGISGSVTAPHPKKNAKEYLIAKTDVADGEWHHIIIQYGYEDGRTQIWVDSKLERQYNVRPEDGGTTQTDVLGFNGTNTIRPYIIGFNSSEEILRSEFETSGWNFSPGRFISSQDVLLNYAAYDKYDPIKVEPMAATTTMTEDNNGSGNKKKALLLYWWPQDRQTYLSEPQIFDTGLTTIDNPKSAPQEFEGWDVFPLSVTGRHGLSDILNKSVVKTNAGYINLETGSPRMLDLINDVDIDQFDAIFFKNYPETSDDIDEYIRNEYVDKYFGLTEKDLYEQFLLSLRTAVDTGVSLYVTSKQLALDLKIVKTFNFIPTFDDRFKDTPLSIEYPRYAGNDIRSIELTNADNWDDETNSTKPTILLRSKYAINDKNTQYWPDRNNNMKHRVLNQVEYLTDDSTYIFTDRAFYQNDDNVDFLAPSRHFQRFEYRLNGLQIGDEFVFGNPSYKTALGNSRSNQNNGFWAVHKDDILAGIPITGQPLKYYSQNELVDNPYKDYVHSIALQPGTTLNGKGLGGKIFVSISEVFWDETLETSIVDLVTDYWIDIAYENGILGPVGSLRAMSTRDRYKIAAQYISEDDKTTEKYDFLTYWSRNDDYAFTQTDQGDQFAGTIGLLFDDIEKVGKVPNTRSSLPSSARARDSLGRFASGASGASGGTLWFKAVTGRFTPTMNVYVPNILTRGFWWLSDRIRLNGLVVRATPMTASSSFVNANAVPDKDTTILSQSMVSSATLASPSNYSFADIKIAILPMTASAEIVKPGKQIMATPMLAVSQFKNPGVATTGEEEVVLIIDNKIAEVYIREDKIK